MRIGKKEPLGHFYFGTLWNGDLTRIRGSYLAYHAYPSCDNTFRMEVKVMKKKANTALIFRSITSFHEAVG